MAGHQAVRMRRQWPGTCGDSHVCFLLMRDLSWDTAWKAVHLNRQQNCCFSKCWVMASSPDILQLSLLQPESGPTLSSVPHHIYNNQDTFLGWPRRALAWLLWCDVLSSSCPKPGSLPGQQARPGRLTPTHSSSSYLYQRFLSHCMDSSFLPGSC